MLTRRETLKMLGAGFGVVGMADSLVGSASQQPHFAPKAKHVIFLYLNGGLSHVDSFDPKPELTSAMEAEPMPEPGRSDGSRLGRAGEVAVRGFGLAQESGDLVGDIFPENPRLDRRFLRRSLDVLGER